jgi:hypothetical protein
MHSQTTTSPRSLRAMAFSRVARSSRTLSVSADQESMRIDPEAEKAPPKNTMFTTSHASGVYGL